MRKVEQKLIVEEFYTRFQEKYEKCQCFYSSDWLERPSVKREVTGSTPVRNVFPLFFAELMKSGAKITRLLTATTI